MPPFSLFCFRLNKLKISQPVLDLQENLSSNCFSIDGYKPLVITKIWSGTARQFHNRVPTSTLVSRARQNYKMSPCPLSTMLAHRQGAELISSSGAPWAQANAAQCRRWTL